MAEALRRNGLPVEVQLFEDEGHGFRKQTTQIQVLEETEAFFRRQLGLTQPPKQRPENIIKSRQIKTRNRPNENSTYDK